MPYLGFSPTTINRILIWGLVGIGFDLLFGYTGLLSFGQSAFFGTGGMFAAYLLTQTSFTNTIAAVILGTIAAGVIGYLVGLIALRRTGIYFAMITVAIAEVFFFVEFNPLSAFTGGENGLPGVPTPNLNLWFTTIEFDGNLGLVIGGGGASLTAFDAVRSHGGRPANYCEIGGNPSVKKACGLTKLILSKPGVKKIAVMMNVVSNTRVDIVARGVIKGCVESGRNPADTIAIFRIPGAWEDDGFKILKKYGVEYCDRTVSMYEAAGRAVAKMK